MKERDLKNSEEKFIFRLVQGSAARKLKRLGAGGL